MKKQLVESLQRCENAYLDHAIKIVDKAINGDIEERLQSRWAFTANFLLEDGYRKQEWISVKDKLPENQKDVLCYYGFDNGDGDLGMMFIGTLCYFCFDKNPHWQHAKIGLVVTHWMPLPEAPKGEER